MKIFLRILKEILFGILIGLSNIIPGFSGGTMILILGIYEFMTGNIAAVTKKPLEVIKNLWAYGVGIILGVLIGTFTVKKCLELYPLITSSFFVGLVIGTIYIVFKEIKKMDKKISVAYIISFLCCAGISVFLIFAEKMGLQITLTEPNVLTVILVFLVGAIAAATMVVPAASGALVLLAFGLYEPIINLLHETLSMFKTGDFTNLLNNLLIIIPFGIGAIIGVIGISKIITKLFDKHAGIVWYGILGLLFAAIFALYYNAFVKHINLNPDLYYGHEAINIILSVVVGIVALVALILASRQADKISQKEK